MNRGAEQRARRARDSAKCHVCHTKEIYDCRWLRSLVLKATRDYPAGRLPSSDDYVFLIGLSAICLYTAAARRGAARRRDRTRAGLMLTNRHVAYLYLPSPEDGEANEAHRDRNSPKLDFRSLLASRRPGEVSKITLLSGCHRAVSERNESRRSLSCGDRAL